MLRLANVLVASALLSGCGIGCWFAPCDQALVVLVSVKDPSGAPLQGVHVDVLGRAGETDGNGCLKLGGVVHSDDLFLLADKPGYKTYEESKVYDFYRIDVTLEPADSPRPSTAAWEPSSASDAPLQCRPGASP